MREIKFRAWDKQHKRLVSDVQDTFENAHFADYLYDDTFELMQYTGLKDKNGVEIYEGDIVQKPADVRIGSEIVAHKGEHDIAIVEWIEGSFRLNKFGDKSKNYYGVLAYTLNNEPSLLKVIGNIYENPELRSK